MFHGVFRRVPEEAGRFELTVFLNLFNRSAISTLQLLLLTSFRFTPSLNVSFSSVCLSLLSDSSSVKGRNTAKLKSNRPLLIHVLYLQRQYISTLVQSD